MLVIPLKPALLNKIRLLNCSAMLVKHCTPKEPTYRIIVKYSSNNPILDLEEVSIVRLMSNLNLSEKRIIELVERDYIWIDSFSCINIRKTRGSNYYPVTKTIYRVRS